GARANESGVRNGSRTRHAIRVVYLLFALCPRMKKAGRNFCATPAVTLCRGFGSTVSRIRCPTDGGEAKKIAKLTCENCGVCKQRWPGGCGNCAPIPSVGSNRKCQSVRKWGNGVFISMLAPSMHHYTMRSSASFQKMASRH